MFDLVFEHQQPRIMTYLTWLRRAFQLPKSTTRTSETRADAFTAGLRSQPVLRTRTWVDHTGQQLKIPMTHTAQAIQASDWTLTNNSVKIAENDASDLFATIEKLCQVDSADSERELLKLLMTDTFRKWRTLRSQSAVKSYLHRRFAHWQKERKDVEKALLFLSRVYSCPHTFVEAAKRISSFRSVDCVPIFHRSSKSQHPRRGVPKSPLDIVQQLGLSVTQPAWLKYLDQNSSKLATLRREKYRKPCMHAELQALCHYNLSLRHDEKWLIHPYIGCSRRCCFLCYCYILTCGGFGVRGTHETIIHRWEMPQLGLTEDIEQDEGVLDATKLFFNVLKEVLKSLLTRPFPLHHRDLLPQSSYAMSSATIFLETEMASWDRPQAELR